MSGAAPTPAPRPGPRRRLPCGIAAVLALLLAAGFGAARERGYTIAFANLTEEPGVTLEGTGFTGRQVREGFVLAARHYPVDLVLYDNARSNEKALANAADAIARKIDLYIQYHADAATNAEIGRRLRAAGIPVLAINHPVPGAPLYTADNAAAGRIAGDALADFAGRAWRGLPTLAVVIGNVRAREDRVPERVDGIVDALKRRQPALRIATLDTEGNPARTSALLGKVLAAHPSAKLLIAATDDATALAARSALESAGRLPDGAIVGQGVDPSIHGGMNDRKEIDPGNRGSIVLGSVAFYLDRYGYDVLPLALRMLRGEPVPPRTPTPHKLVTAANVFVEYPPYDMN